jgi:hypothetical protein
LINTLLRIAERDDPEAKTSALMSLKNIARAILNRRKMLLHPGLIDAVLAVASTATGDPQTKALNTLHNIAMVDREYKYEVFLKYYPGVIDAVLAVASTATGYPQTAALKTLKIIATGHRENTRAMFLYPGLIDAVLAVASTATGDPQTAALQTLQRIAERNPLPVWGDNENDKTKREMFLHPGLIDAVLAVASTATGDPQTAALETLNNIAHWNPEYRSVIDQRLRRLELLRNLRLTVIMSVQSARRLIINDTDACPLHNVHPLLRLLARVPSSEDNNRLYYESQVLRHIVSFVGFGFYLNC